MSNLPKIQLAMLFDVYGVLLTEKQRNILDLYCNLDYSLGEIAQNLSITRQGVFDAVAVSEKALTEFEKNLQILKKDKEFADILQQARHLLSQNKLQELEQLLSQAE